MTILHLQYGEVLTDDAINWAVGLPAGIFEVGTPIVAGTGPWSVSLPPAASGFLLWRDAGSQVHARMNILEPTGITWATIDAPTGGEALAGYYRIDLLVGSHHWAAPSTYGTMTAEMGAVYGVVKGNPALIPSAPAPPGVYPNGWTAPSPGGVPVVLAQVLVPPSGTPTVTFWPSTDMRLTNLGPLVNEIVAARSGFSDLSTALSNLIPPGMVVPFAGTTPPSGYLICDGSAVLRSTYSRLFNVLGVTYGAGDGTTTFNLPNLAGRFPLGTAPAYPAASTGGEANHALSTAEMPGHSHAEFSNDSVDYFTGTQAGVGTTVAKIGLPGGGNHAEGYAMMAGSSAATIGLTSSVGSGSAHNNMPPYLVLTYIVKT